MTRREAILDYVGTLLAAAPPVGVVPLRARSKALESKDLPAESYYPKTDRVQPVHRVPGAEGEGGVPAGTKAGDTVRRQLLIAVECAAKAGPGTSPDEQLDAMFIHVTKALAGVGADWKTVGAISASEVETIFEFENLDVPVCLATHLFRIEYLTKAGDPEVL